MKNSQKGFAIPIIIAILALIILGGGVFFYANAPSDIATDSDMIRVNQPIVNAIVSSPLMVTGEARGGWYFEGDFPVKIEDANGNVLGQHYASANGEWMTVEFVPFTSKLAFRNSTTETGVLILTKNNPSDLREYDDEIRIPVRFDLKLD